MSKALLFNSRAEMLAHASKLAKSFGLCQMFDYNRTFTATASSSNTEEIPIGAGSSFQILGYNIEYNKSADGTEGVSLKFSQEYGNRVWSNGFLPIKSIAVPGVRDPSVPLPRFGYRQFQGYAPANDKIKIDWNNTLAEDIEVSITVIGFLLMTGEA